ncbi:hypothetical protein HUU42_03930 [bacterium]|nr:hypothetical protein [bacterium]
MKNFKHLVSLLILSAFVVMVACSDDDNNGSDQSGIAGVWLSEGTNVAPLLNTIFAAAGGVDSIYATFATSDTSGNTGTYSVRQVNGNSSVVSYSGTYTETKSIVDNIYAITINQSIPSVTENGGIFEIYNANPDSMKYEVVLLTGTSNVAPTPAGGFGSTNAGAFGVLNVQRYIRLSE